MVGDQIRLREWEPNTLVFGERELMLKIVYVLRGTGPGGVAPYRGLAAGYAILGIEIITPDWRELLAAV